MLKALIIAANLTPFAAAETTQPGSNRGHEKSAKSKVTAKGPGTYQIESPVKGISVVQNGVLSGSSGTALTGQIGLNEIILSAPNYASRKIRFWIKANEVKTLRVEMVELSDPSILDWKTSFKRFDPDLLESKNSRCIRYRAKSQDASSCDRKTFLDDILYADDSVFRQEDLRAFQEAGVLGDFRRLLAHIQRIEASPAIEDFLSKHPEQLSAYHLASLHSLLRGDCPRIQTLATELSQIKKRFAPLAFHMAICAEAQNDRNRRDQILADGLKDKLSIETLAYWAGLNAIETSLPKASEYALTCLKSKANDSRCTDLQNMVLSLQDKKTKMSHREFEDRIFKNFMNIEDKLPKGGQEALYFETTALIEQHPLAIENYLALSWINMFYAKELYDDDYADLRIRVASVKAGSTLDKVVASIEKAELTQLLPPIYRRRLTFSPDDPNLWYRLIRSYSKANQCKPMLKAFQEGEAFLPKFNPSLLQMRGACEMSLSRFPAAVATYKKIMEVSPALWSSPFNLAVAYEQDGKKTEAYGYFKKVLDLNPPEEIKGNIEARLRFLEPRTGK